MVIIKCAGGVIVGPEYQVLVVRKRKSNMVRLPQGERWRDKTALDSAIQRIYEQTGFTRDDLKHPTELGKYTRHAADGRQKNVELFLFQTERTTIADDPWYKSFWLPREKVADQLTSCHEAAFYEAIRKNLLRPEKKGSYLTLVA